MCSRWFGLNEKTYPWDDRHWIFFLWSGGEGAEVGGTRGVFSLGTCRGRRRETGFNGGEGVAKLSQLNFSKRKNV